MSTAPKMNSIEDMHSELLGNAFTTFRDASRKLEQQYALLEKKVEVLNAEIVEKNRAMERNRRLAAMGEMAAKIAHEIRNPLGSVAIFASLLERDLEGDSERKTLAENINKGVKTLDNLLSNMLLFAGSPVASRRTLDLREVIEDSVMLAGAGERDDIEIETRYRGGTSLQADEGLLRQLFMNLVLNAVDAMEGGGRLAITTDRSPDCVEIVVEDTGSGIDEEDLDRVFDPFFSTKDRGTGLGMAIVATVVSAHQGEIDVDSVPGTGTRFTIKLPAERGGDSANEDTRS